MKKYFLFLFLIVSGIEHFNAQIIAGSTSSGLIISNPTVSFSVTSFTSDRRAFDLDCDGIADMSVELHKGPTAIDASNNAYLHILNPSFQVCADTANWQPRNINYFNLADTIICPQNTNWYSDTIMQLGNCGCMGCSGPCSITDLYLGYKNTITSQIGWIKISFNLLDGGVAIVPITLSIPEVLSPCVTTSVSSVPTNTNSSVSTCGVFSYSYTIHQPSCFNSCDGSILISNLTGGSPPYNYLWLPGLESGPNAINILCSGTNSLIISDGIGNTCTASFVISDPAPITFSLNSVNALCYGTNTGSVCCTNLMGGTAPYSIMWVPFGGNTLCVNNLPIGLYNFIVTDENGCVATGSVSIYEPLPIQVTESITQASCASCCDGNSQLQVSGGVPPYTSVYTNIPSCPGIYGYMVTDANGCVFTDSVLISYPTATTEHFSESRFDVFPNPSKGNFEIKKLSAKNSDVKIQVIDMYGKVVFATNSEMQNQKFLLNLNIEEGIYFLHISETDSNNEFVKKIIILK